MTAKLRASSPNLLDENFDATELHPADIEQIIIAAYDEYENLGKFDRIRKRYRDKFNSLVDLLTEKRGFMQFSYLS